MLLKRHYDAPREWEAQKNTRGKGGALLDPNREEGALLNPLPVDAIAVIHTGTHPEQRFSRRFVDAGVAEGWITLSRGHILLHTQQEDLRYTLVRMPGRYCLHCGQHWASDPSGSEARAHIAATHAGVATPDPAWPLGYEALEAYECVLDAAQHARWQRPAYATVSHARWKDAAKAGDGKPAARKKD